MFATLDPTVRSLRLPSHRRALLSDTVGFIRDLPPSLIAAFRATLEEVQEAALILQVTDVSNPLHVEHDGEVEKVLVDLGVADRPRLRVFNKIDRLDPAQLEMLRESHGRASFSPENPNDKILVSAHTGAGLEDLVGQIDRAMPVDPIVERHLTMPMANGRELAMIYACGRVLNSEVLDGHIHVQAELPASLAARLHSFGSS
jgi:GTPase